MGAYLTTPFQTSWSLRDYAGTRAGYASGIGALPRGLSRNRCRGLLVIRPQPIRNRRVIHHDNALERYQMPIWLRQSIAYFTFSAFRTRMVIELIVQVVSPTSSSVTRP